MSKTKKDLHTGTSEQGSLFDSDLEAGTLDVSMPFRDALSKAIRKCQYSTWQVAALISRLSGHNVSEDMLNKVKASDPAYALRAEDLPAIIYVTQSLEPARVLMEAVGGTVSDHNESKFVKLARLEQDNARLQGEIIKLKSELGIRR
ncbi:MAG: hypothetical protein C4560_02890 [Nitrospiraceae bacterium]|nr:MAG: hypothetical protein C4560_02890 [Nitrospiraceae bacterium]